MVAEVLILPRKRFQEGSHGPPLVRFQLVTLSSHLIVLEHSMASLKFQNIHTVIHALTILWEYLKRGTTMRRTISISFSKLSRHIFLKEHIRCQHSLTALMPL